MALAPFWTKAKLPPTYTVVPICVNAETSVVSSVLTPLASPVTPQGVARAPLSSSGAISATGVPVSGTAANVRSARRSLGRRYIWANGTADP